MSLRIVDGSVKREGIAANCGVGLKIFGKTVRSHAIECRSGSGILLSVDLLFGLSKDSLKDLLDGKA
jgi:hypothetical protein